MHIRHDSRLRPTSPEIPCSFAQDHYRHLPLLVQRRPTTSSCSLPSPCSPRRLTKMGSTTASNHLDVAIIGGGITGLTLALGLQARNLRYTIYERATSLKEIGAGVGFSPNAEQAMELLNPDVHAAFKAVANANGEDYFQWVDGYATGQLIYKLYVGEGKFQGCRRSDFVEGLAKKIPSDRIKYGKEVIEIRTGNDKRPIVVFKDGDQIVADIVIGADGIRSITRQQLLGPSNPASHPSYTHRCCFRALIPIPLASDAITHAGGDGPYSTSTRFMYNGPDGHIITYPVANDTLLNILVVMTDYCDWKAEDGKMTARTTKVEAVEFFKDWKHPAVKAIVNELLPEVLDKWGVFDMMKDPAERYHEGCVVLAGDAAHAAGPHLGGGAGMGIEDALVLATALEVVEGKLEGVGEEEQVRMCEMALETYNQVRYERTQWLIKATREACALFHLKPPEVPSKQHNEMFGKEISERFHTIWDADVEGMAKETRRLLEAGQ